MNIFRNKLFIGLICILIGVTVAFFAIPGVVEREVATAKVYVAAQTISAGDFITEAQVEEKVIPASLAPANKVDETAAIGKRAVSVIYGGDIITTDKITETYVPLDTYSIATDKGKMVMSISANNLPASVAARILPGDVVTVLALPTNRSTAQTPSGLTPGGNVPEQTEEVVVNEEGEVIANETPTLTPASKTPQTISYPELENLEVAAIVTSTGTNASVKEELTAEEENKIPTTISFYVTKEQALRLAELERYGNAYIVFKARGNSAYGFIPETEKVLILDDVNY